MRFNCTRVLNPFPNTPSAWRPKCTQVGGNGALFPHSQRQINSPPPVWPKLSPAQHPVCFLLHARPAPSCWRCPCGVWRSGGVSSWFWSRFPRNNEMHYEIKKSWTKTKNEEYQILSTLLKVLWCVHNATLVGATSNIVISPPQALLRVPFLGRDALRRGNPPKPETSDTGRLLLNAAAPH